MASAFIAIGIFKWPLFETILALAALSIAVGYLERE
jgi:uncharacterized membrane protein